MTHLSSRFGILAAFPVSTLLDTSPADVEVAASALLKRIVDRQGYDFSTDLPETTAVPSGESPTSR